MRGLEHMSLTTSRAGTHAADICPSSLKEAEEAVVLISLLLSSYRIRYLDDDGKPYDDSVDEWLPPSCLRETSVDYEPIKAKVGSLLSVKRKKKYYNATTSLLPPITHFDLQWLVL